MPILTSDTAWLREHPFGDPLSDQPAFKQWHSYIFPGDEILLYHEIELPTVTGADSISDIKLVSAKASILAQKPQVFSEEFSEEFESTQYFELDAFEVPFNNSNAPIVPWNADGYAPNIHLQQDRNWRLPSGDLRRQINFFTEHTDELFTWNYYFYFPILFRWEYWLSKLNVSNDFFDMGQTENGQNEFWYHYFVINKWRIVSRLEITVLVNGANTIIRSERNLSAYINSINTYNANTDWTDKSIKTAKVGGTPSNSPAFVYGNKDTAVYAYFEKVSAWGVDEQDNISAVMWIEPYLGGGRPARTRASTIYPITPESVFKGLDTSLTDDSGTGITTDGGDYVITSPTGNGVLRWFNGTDPKEVTFLGIIDWNKLKAAYPGETKFTIYARLYNSTPIPNTIFPGIPVGQTKKGEAIKQDLILIAPADGNDLCGLRLPMCPFNIDVFADLEDSDDLKNDKSAFYQYAFADVSAIKFTLQKAVDNCTDEWTDQVDITDSSYGLFFEYGKKNDFSGDDYEDDYGKKYTGVFLSWNAILDEFGVGRYRMKITKTPTIAGADVIEYDQRTFCLKEYNCNLTNRTVRIDILNEGVRGTLFDITAYIDYMDGWRDQLRLKGVFTYKGSSYNKEYVQYGDGNFNMYRPTINEQQAKFTLSIKPVPGWMDWILSTDILQADEMLVTDYNANNRHTFVKVPVMNDGDISPANNQLTNPLSSVEISLAYGQNNLRKRN